MKNTVAIMRPQGYLEDSLALVKSLDFEAVVCPMLEVRAYQDENFNDFVSRTLEGDVDYVIFTSANGVDFTLERITEREAFLQALNHATIVAIGPQTRRALEKAGIHVSLLPDRYSSLGLIDVLQQVSGKRVDVVRSTHGAPVLVQKLSERGALVQETCVYTIVRSRGMRQQRFIREVLDGEVDVLPFTSTMMVCNFMETAREECVLEEMLRLLNSEALLVGAIGKPTAATLEGYGVERVIVPQRYLFRELLLSLKEAADRLKTK
jgi:uroporphyrinogen-III synthase